MADTLRELVVRLSLDSGSFSGDIKAVNTAVKQAEANFKQAGAGVSGFDKSLAGAKAKVEMLTSKLTAQNTAVEKHKAKLDASKKALADNQKQQASLAQKIDAAKKAYEAQSNATGKNSDEAKTLGAELKKLEGQQKSLEKQATRQAKAINTGELALTNAKTAAKETEAALKTANKEVERASTVWGRFGAATAGAQKGLEQAGQKLTTAGRKMTMGLTLPIVAAGTTALKTAIDWESAFAGVQKTVDGTDQQMKSLHDGIIDMSKVLPTSAVDIAKVAENAGQLGIQTDSILGFSRVMIDLGETTNLSADQAAIALAQFANITQMSQSDFDRLGATIVDLGNNYATTEADIVSMATRLAGAGKQVKMSEANILAISAAMSSVGIEAEMGGSAMSKVMLNIDMAAAKGGKEIAKYAKVSGLSAKEFTAAWKSDPAKALSTFVGGLAAVEKSGGNVAMTLEELGYKEVRTRDALLRLTGASEIMSSALGTANTAWSENVALANEAEKRYGTNASKLQMLKNQAIATGISFGNAMTPHLEAAMGAISNIIKGFEEMDAGTQQTVIGLLAVSAGIGPVLSGLGKMATGASVLMKAFSGPAGWITLAVGALAGLGVYIASLDTPIEKLDKSLKGVRLEVDETQKTALTKAINDGISAANKLHNVRVNVKADTSKIVSQLEAAFADGKFTGKEFNAAKKYVDNIVKADIAAAKEALALQVTDFRTTLGNSVDSLGNPIFSSERQEELASAVTSKTTGLIGELEQANKDYKALLAQIYKDKDTPTEAELEKLNELLEKIGEIRVKLQAEQDKAILVAQAYAELALSGGGTPETTAQGAAFVQETAKLETEAEKKKLDEKLAANQQTINAIKAQGGEAAATTAEVAALQASSTKAIEDYGTAVAEISAKSQTEVQAMIDAHAAKYPEAKAEVDRWVLLWDTLAALNAMDKKLESGEDITPNDYKSILTPEVIAKYFAPDHELVTKGVEKAWENGAPLATYVQMLQQKLTEEAAKPLDAGVVSPISTMINTMLNNGTLEGVDVTKLDGMLLNMWKLASFETMGTSVGTDAVGGVVAGTIAAGDALTGTDFASLNDAFIKALNAAFGIKSPAVNLKPSGRQITAGLAAGVADATDEFTSAIAALYKAGTDEANKQEIILRNHLAWLASTRPQGAGAVPTGTTNNTTNNTNTVNVSTVVRNETDAKVLAAQIEGMNRRARAGYGTQ